VITGGATIDVDAARRGVENILARWHGSETSHTSTSVLVRFLGLLAPMRTIASGQPADAQSLVNAQISVDTEHPERLRLTLDPFAGRPFWEVRKEELLAVLDVLACPALSERALQLYRLGYALPQTFWLGVAPTPSDWVMKAYVSSPDPILRPWLSHLARDAGWLPATLQRGFMTLYEQLTPSMATLEGIGISFLGLRQLGTTFYLRSSLPWVAIASPLIAALLRLTPSESLETISSLFPEEPAAVGWSVECDADGALVDLKLETAVKGRCSDEHVAAYARRMGLDAGPLRRLADEVGGAGLSVGDRATPAVLSLRFAQGALRSMVAYFPLALQVMERPGFRPAG
jgi:hypothetical protein